MVHITFSMPESTLSLSFVKVPLTFVMSTISPVLDAVTMSELQNAVIILTGSLCVVRHSLVAIIFSQHFLAGLILLFHLASVH